MAKIGTASSHQELDDVIGAFIEMTERIIDDLSETSPGGKSITLDELLHTVTDGDVRESLRKFYEMIQLMIHGEHVDIIDLVTISSTAILELIANVKIGLADGTLSPDDIVNGITTGHLRDSIKKAIDGIDKVGEELANLGPIGLIMTIQKYVGRLMDLIKKFKH